jgi:hypothetical protein
VNPEELPAMIVRLQETGAPSAQCELRGISRTLPNSSVGLTLPGGLDPSLLIFTFAMQECAKGDPKAYLGLLAMLDTLDRSEVEACTQFSGFKELKKQIAESLYGFQTNCVESRKEEESEGDPDLLDVFRTEEREQVKVLQNALVQRHLSAGGGSPGGGALNLKQATWTDLLEAFGATPPAPSKRGMIRPLTAIFVLVVAILLGLAVFFIWGS